MPDQKIRPNSPKTLPPARTVTPMAALRPAGEASDPAVHKLLADLEIARSNGDIDGVKAAQQALADLGFSA